MNKIQEELAKPFSLAEYEWRVQSESKAGDKVQVCCYVTNRAIQQRLDEVFGPLGWQVRYEPGPAGGVMCTISVWDSDTKQWVDKADGAENSTIESVKGGYSNACKRAACPWGIGRLLYKLPNYWLPLNQHGERYHKPSKYWDEPTLPDWAVAGENKKPQGKTDKTDKPATQKAETKTEPAPTNRRNAYLATCKKHGCYSSDKLENYATCAKLLDSDHALRVAEELEFDPGLFALTTFTAESLPPENDVIWTILTQALDGVAADKALAAYQPTKKAK